MNRQARRIVLARDRRRVARENHRVRQMLRAHHDATSWLSAMWRDPTVAAHKSH